MFGAAFGNIIEAAHFSDGLFVMCACLGVFASCAARSRCREEGMIMKRGIRVTRHGGSGYPNNPWVIRRAVVKPPVYSGKLSF